jgi:cytochrome c oxidase subunit II
MTAPENPDGPEATESPAAPDGLRSSGGNSRHGWRIFGIWVVLSLVADLLIWFELKPILPPGDMSDSAAQQSSDIAVLMVTGVPVLIGVVTYFIYAITTWRSRGDTGDGAPIYGNTRVAATWIIGSSMIVLWCFAFGTVELSQPGGAGAAEGSSPIWSLTGKTSNSWSPSGGDMLQVQVIGQQWTWTFRYPQFGGMETSVLYLPIDTPVEFHVTSLDVIHSFWAYQLGVKADANPGTDDVAYTTPEQLGSFRVECSELCGIWHGAMFTSGHVVTQTSFEGWAVGVMSQETNDGLLKALPAYSLTYDPTVLPELTSSNNLNKVDGITGAAGYYYPSTDPVTP